MSNLGPDLENFLKKMDEQNDSKIETKAVINFISNKLQEFEALQHEGLDDVHSSMTRCKNNYYEDLIMPNTFWCTFMNAKAKQQAIGLKNLKFSDADPKINDQIKIEEPEAPSDILWLN